MCAMTTSNRDSRPGNQLGIELGPDVLARGRQRGLHSVKCLNPNPTYQRPARWKALPGELGKTFARCSKRDVSCDPFFVYLREAAGRQRHFKPERSNLLNAVFRLMISRCDLDTGIVGISLEDIATELDVTPCRISRLVNEVFIPFGLAYVLTAENQEQFEHLAGQALPDYSEQAKDGKVWDRVHGRWFPKILVLTDQFWRIAGANLDKLHAQAERQLQDKQRGYVEFGQVLSVKEARELRRREINAISWEKRQRNSGRSKTKSKLMELSFDEGKRYIAEQLRKDHPNLVNELSPEAFEARVFKELFRLKVGPPGTRLQ